MLRRPNRRFRRLHGRRRILQTIIHVLPLHGGKLWRISHSSGRRVLSALDDVLCVHRVRLFALLVLGLLDGVTANSRRHGFRTLRGLVVRTLSGRLARRRFLISLALLTEKPHGFQPSRLLQFFLFGIDLNALNAISCVGSVARRRKPINEIAQCGRIRGILDAIERGAVGLIQIVIA